MWTCLEQVKFYRVIEEALNFLWLLYLTSILFTTFFLSIALFSYLYWLTEEQSCLQKSLSWDCIQFNLRKNQSYLTEPINILKCSRNKFIFTCISTAFSWFLSGCQICWLMWRPRDTAWKWRRNLLQTNMHWHKFYISVQLQEFDKETPEVSWNNIHLKWFIFSLKILTF